MQTVPKDYNIQLDTKYKIGGESITLVQGDNHGNIFNFTLTEDGTVIDLTGSIISITMVKKDNTIVVNQCTIVNALEGKCKYIVDIDALSCVGQVVYTVEIYKDGGRTTTTHGKFKVIAQLDDGTKVESEGNYNILSTLIQEVNVTQNTFIANENIRLENEDDRIKNEDNRFESENIRIKNEDLRVSNEINRNNEFNRLKHESEQSTEYATNRGSYANVQGDNAKAAAIETRQVMSSYIDVVEQTKKVYMPSANTYADILTTYPVPQIGWTVQAKDTHIEYRFDGLDWIDIGVSDMFQGYNVHVGPTPPTNTNLLWVHTGEAENRLTKVLPSKTEPLDKNVIWWQLD